MSDKYDSDTLRQQKIAREEFLKLKRMQNGEETPPPPPSSQAITPATLGEKSKNFWYYYRWAVLGTVFVVAVLVFCIAQCASRVNYDLMITVYTSSMVGDSDCKKMEKYFEKFCTDINGDGEARVQINNCSYNEQGGTQILYATNSKFQAIIAAEPKAVLFITDDTSFEKINDISEDTDFFEGDGTPLPESFYSKCEDDDLYTLPRGLKISRRNFSKSYLEKNDTTLSCFSEAGSILEKLLAED